MTASFHGLTETTNPTTIVTLEGAWNLLIVSRLNDDTRASFRAP
jgi:hypothetical protein